MRDTFDGILAVLEAYNDAKTSPLAPPRAPKKVLN
jgi:hypothetical protein